MWHAMKRIVPAACVVALALGGLGAGLPALPDRALAASNSQGSTAQSDYGHRLAASAKEQVSLFVLYSPGYQKIPYPMGDIPAWLGVCTDVIVRAYRRLGIDLQVEVKKAGVGSGDTNIDHRRVNVLRAFFAKRGRSLPVSSNPADYRPGDIVTYYLPDGTFSKTHIAIVSDERNAEGVPLIIHNIGYGVAHEDWLFGEKITGHYRYHPVR